MLPIELLTSIALFTLPKLASAATASGWSSRSIYQVMTDRFALTDGSSPPCDDLASYCGGTWSGIKNNLDYIQDMGFTAIQISPVIKNMPESTERGESYHGFWGTDWYSLNEHFGSAQDLQDLAKALHERGMLFMVDVVLNDVAVKIDAEADEKTVIDYSQFNPFNEEKYFHPWCNITSTNSRTADQDCWTSSNVVALPDLKTESPTVQTMALTWAKQLVSNYSIDGLRIHRAVNIDSAFLKKFTNEVGVFTMGEVYLEDLRPLCEYMKVVDAVLNFVTYFAIMEAFAGEEEGDRDMVQLGEIVKDMGEKCGDVGLLGTFFENHDTTRFATANPDIVLAMNAIAFTILADGIPTIYQNQEQHVTGNFTPNNRTPLWTQSYNTTSPLYNLTRTLLTLRNHAQLASPSYLTSPTTTLHLRKQYYITRKGAPSSSSSSNQTQISPANAETTQNQTQIIAAYFNIDEIPRSANVSITVKGAGFEKGTKVMEVIGCEEVVAGEEGELVFIVDGKPKVLYEMEGLVGSGLCGFAMKAKETVEGGSGSGSEEGTKEGDGKKEEEKSEAMRLSVRVSFMGAALGVVGLGALVWL